MDGSGGSFDFDDMFNSSPQIKTESPENFNLGQSPNQGGSMSDPLSAVKLEKSRQSARECRARKKLRYQYLDDMISEREKANLILRAELQKYVSWCQDLDSNKVPDGLQEFLKSADMQPTPFNPPH